MALGPWMGLSPCKATMSYPPPHLFYIDIRRGPVNPVPQASFVFFPKCIPSHLVFWIHIHWIRIQQAFGKSASTSMTKSWKNYNFLQQRIPKRIFKFQKKPAALQLFKVWTFAFLHPNPQTRFRPDLVRIRIVYPLSFPCLNPIHQFCIQVYKPSSLPHNVSSLPVQTGYPVGGGGGVEGGGRKGWNKTREKRGVNRGREL